MRRWVIACCLAWLYPYVGQAQTWMHLHTTYAETAWQRPFRVAEDYFTLTDEGTKLTGHFENKQGTEILVPYRIEDIDSLTFASGLTDEEKGHNRYTTFALYIQTPDQASISRDDWTLCQLSLDGKGEYSDYSGTARIKGRGNSTWSWYDKKPYKIKLDAKSKLLGLDKAKDWNLLANYRDVTDMMNTVAFETARYMGMPQTLHTRYVEVFLNGDYVGLYQLTERIEVDDNRLNLDRDEGILLSLDLDDGPSLSPYATNNFFSKVYALPVCVKYPDDPTSARLSQIIEDFAVMESAVQARDYTLLDSLVDLPSFIGAIQLHEYLYNVELDAPRSLYLWRDKAGKYTFGPVWDWDAAFDFDWSNMYTGHDFFSNYKELIMGTAPYTGVGASYSINGFFTDMFANRTFVSRYKEQWQSYQDSLYLKPWSIVSEYVTELNRGAYERDLTRWPISGKTVSAELSKMRQWLQKRLSYINTVVANYPEGNDEADEAVEVVATINKTASCQFSKGYSQNGRISLSESDVTARLGGTPTSLVPLNADGTEGRNTAAGTYGAWFNDEGSTTTYDANSHVYIESNELYSWYYGCHPSLCASGDQHIVTMQFRRDGKAVNVCVTFSVN